MSDPLNAVYKERYFDQEKRIRFLESDLAKARQEIERLKGDQVCTICGSPTEYACSDCRIDFRTTVFVCTKSECRDRHEKKCSHQLSLEIDRLRKELKAWGIVLNPDNTRDVDLEVYHQRLHDVAIYHVEKERDTLRASNAELRAGLKRLVDAITALESPINASMKDSDKEEVYEDAMRLARAALLESK